MAPQSDSYDEMGFWKRRGVALHARLAALLRGRLRPQVLEHFTRAHSVTSDIPKRQAKIDWCTKNCRGPWFLGLKIEFDHGFPGSTLYRYRFTFFDDVDAIMFKMHWPGEWD